MFEKLHIPGAFWIALIAFVMEWLPKWFPGQPWLPYALLGLLAVSEVVEVLVTSPVAANERGLSSRQGASLLRFLL
jgi:hypothetical protein